METPEHQTPVLFRKDYEASEWHITAVFPTEPATIDGYTMTCYAHLGQHGACSMGWYIKTKAAKPSEYADLQKELQAIGYNLKVYHRMTPQHRAALRNAVNAYRSA